MLAHIAMEKTLSVKKPLLLEEKLERKKTELKTSQALITQYMHELHYD